MKNAVSLSCRLNLAKKKVTTENVHPSWNEIGNSSDLGTDSETK